MTKTEVLEALARKIEANQDCVRMLIEQLCAEPGAVVTNEQHGDIMQKISVVWKEGRAMTEIANELVGLVYPNDAPAPQQPPELRPS
jgi:hypothetical protein